MLCNTERKKKHIKFSQKSLLPAQMTTLPGKERKVANPDALVQRVQPHHVRVFELKVEQRNVLPQPVRVRALRDRRNPALQQMAQQHLGAGPAQLGGDFLHRRVVQQVGHFAAGEKEEFD